MQFVGQAENVGGLMNVAGETVDMIIDDAASDIAQQIKFLQHKTQETKHHLHRMKLEQDAMAISYHECTRLNLQLQQFTTQAPNGQSIDLKESEQVKENIRRQKELQEQFVNCKLTGLMQLQLTLANKLKDTLAWLNTLQSTVLDNELIRWKRNQQLAKNGTLFYNDLEVIQKWCESLAQLIWQNKQQVEEAMHPNQRLPVDYPGVQNILPTVNSQIVPLLNSLVTNTFIVEEQPPQVMKINTKFTSRVRLLVGGKLNIHMTPPQVKVSIINEFQANELLKTNKTPKPGKAIGEILNNTGTMEYHEATHQFSVTFSNMQLKKIRRSEKKGVVSVTDEKFALLFQSQFSIGGGEVLNVWTLSLPVVVIVHGNQEPHAWATVTWDNAFAEPRRVPFTVPYKVPWIQVAEALNVKFQSATGRSMTEDNLTFLMEKASRSRSSGSQDYSGLLLSWTQFCKEPLPGRNFTFWEWFYAIMKLTGEHLSGPWMDGYILGFVQKKQAEAMLTTFPAGTFLMRFSDSLLGSLSIASVNKRAEVFMLQPFASKDLTIRSLADRVSDLQELKYLYPTLSKGQAFSKYYTPISGQRTSNKGYVPLTIMVKVVFREEGSETVSQTFSHTSRSDVGRESQGPTASTFFHQPRSTDSFVTQFTASITPSSSPGLSQPETGAHTPFEFPNPADLPPISDSSILEHITGFDFSAVLDIETSFLNLQ